MNITLKPSSPVEEGATYRWKYEVAVTGTTDVDKLSPGERWGLDFPKGTRLKSPEDFKGKDGTMPAGMTAPSSELSTDSQGRPVVFVKLTKAQADAGKFTVEFYADTPLDDSGKPASDYEHMSVEKFSVRSDWSPQSFVPAGTNKKPADDHVLPAPTPVTARPAFEPDDPAEYFAHYEGLKLGHLLTGLGFTGLVAPPPAPVLETVTVEQAHRPKPPRARRSNGRKPTGVGAKRS